MQERIACHDATEQTGYMNDNKLNKKYRLHEDKTQGKLHLCIYFQGTNCEIIIRENIAPSIGTNKFIPTGEAHMLLNVSTHALHRLSQHTYHHVISTTRFHHSLVIHHNLRSYVRYYLPPHTYRLQHVFHNKGSTSASNCHNTRVTTSQYCQLIRIPILFTFILAAKPSSMLATVLSVFLYR